MACKPKIGSKIRSFGIILSTGAATFLGAALYRGDEQFYSRAFMPAMRMVVRDPETAHNLAIQLAKRGIVPANQYHDPPSLKVQLWGKEFANPIGLAAGFDKHAEAVHGIAKMGFGFLEVGSVTPEPQPGNDKPRVFRLETDRAVINRYGFNSVGVAAMKRNLSQSRPPLNSPLASVRVGLNLGKNKSTPFEEGVNDFLKGLEYFHDSMGGAVDYFVFNISSPNTQGLRDFQTRKPFENLVTEIGKAKERLHIERPILIKISPDMSDEELAQIGSIVTQAKTRRSGKVIPTVDGLIISNTTVARPGSLKSSPDLIAETGGLSGEPLRERSTECIRKMYKLTGGKVPIIGVGGVGSGDDAYQKIRAGASLVQIYTALTYDGPPVVMRIKRELAQCLSADGFESVTQAVGRDHDLKTEKLIKTEVAIEKLMKENIIRTIAVN